MASHKLRSHDYLFTAACLILFFFFFFFFWSSRIHIHTYLFTYDSFFDLYILLSFSEGQYLRPCCELLPNLNQRDIACPPASAVMTVAKPRPYRRILTSILHMRFVKSAFATLIACTIISFSISENILGKYCFVCMCFVKGREKEREKKRKENLKV